MTTCARRIWGFDAGPDAAFRAGKRAAARYFYRFELPTVSPAFDLLESLGDDEPAAPDERKHADQQPVPAQFNVFDPLIRRRVEPPFLLEKAPGGPMQRQWRTFGHRTQPLRRFEDGH